MGFDKEMSHSDPKEFKNEAECLRIASIYVGRARIDDAISLLEQARLFFPASKRLLNALGKLYLSAGMPAQAVECFQIILNRIPNSESGSSEELPTDEDVQYLTSQSHIQSEKEYEFIHIDEQDKVEPTGILPRQDVGPAESQLDSTCASVVSEVVVEDLVEISDLNPGYEHPTPPFDNYGDKNESSDFDNDYSAAIQLRLFSDDALNERFDPDEEDIVDDDDTSRDEIIDEIFGIREDKLLNTSGQSDSDVDTDLLVDIYDHWTDETEEDEEEQEYDTGVLVDRLTREERARQAAIECLISFEWNKSELAFLTHVFVVFGWSGAKKAIEREVLSGATHEELKLAFEIKQVWSECDRYWICFSGAWMPGESTVATYKCCSWRQALRLVRIFDGIPCVEEVLDLVESEFDYWFNQKILRSRFPAFSSYLFSYRLNEFLPTINVAEPRRFDSDVGQDELDESWLNLGLSDQMRILGDYGIDVISRSSPKSYYASDRPFDPRELDRQVIKRNSDITEVEDEDQ